MANVTEKDIINHLKEKIRFHQSEIKKIESLLTAFTGNPVPQKLKKADTTPQETIVAEPIIKKKTKSEKKVKVAKPAKSIQIPAEYKSDLSWNSKIIYAINELGDGVFNEDIAAKITELEPGLEIPKVAKQISGLLSVLKTKGALKAERTGKKDRYSLTR
jgi:hypothetical protein